MMFWDGLHREGSLCYVLGGLTGREVFVMFG